MLFFFSCIFFGCCADSIKDGERQLCIKLGKQLRTYLAMMIYGKRKVSIYTT